jgi:hypothetical protein
MAAAASASKIMRPDQSLNIASINRGDLLRIRTGIAVVMGGVKISERTGAYTWRDADEEVNMAPGSIVMFMGLLSDDDDAIVILADGQIGWVFVDEVEVP